MTTSLRHSTSEFLRYAIGALAIAVVAAFLLPATAGAQARVIAEGSTYFSATTRRDWPLNDITKGTNIRAKLVYDAGQFWIEGNGGEADCQISISRRRISGSMNWSDRRSCNIDVAGFAFATFVISGQFRLDWTERNDQVQAVLRINGDAITQNTVTPNFYGNGASLTLSARDPRLDERQSGQQQALVLQVGQTYRLESVNLPGYFVLGGRNGATLAQSANAPFRIVTGLADSSAISFESIDNPGHFLRHQGFRLKQHPYDGSQLFRLDASFYVIPGLSDRNAISFESVNYRGRFIRHRNYEFYLDERGRLSLPADATFRIRQ